MSGPEARRRPYPTHRLHATARTCNEPTRTVFQLQQPQMALERTIFVNNLQQFYKSKQTLINLITTVTALCRLFY